MELSNVEFILLQLVYERPLVSGYDINQIIRERGYREWADIGTTSIYVGLNKLNRKKLVTSYIDTEKHGRGPVPKKIQITESGKEVLRQEILTALSATRERDYRFDLALAAIPVVETDEVVAALESRKQYLTEVATSIKQKLEEQGGDRIPVNLRALYWHPLILIEQELEFMDSLIQDLQKKK